MATAIARVAGVAPTTNHDAASDTPAVSRVRQRRRPGSVDSWVSGGSNEVARELASQQRAIYQDVLRKLVRRDTEGWFCNPVDPTVVPDYYQIVTKPMDFATLSKVRRRGAGGECECPPHLRVLAVALTAQNVSRNAYPSFKAFQSDLRLVFDNTYLYNAPDTPVYAAAKVAEASDREVFAATGRTLSGHTLKHLLAATSMLFFYWHLATRAPL